LKNTNFEEILNVLRGNPFELNFKLFEILLRIRDCLNFKLELNWTGDEKSSNKKRLERSSFFSLLLFSLPVQSLFIATLFVTAPISFHCYSCRHRSNLFSLLLFSSLLSLFSLLLFPSPLQSLFFFFFS